MSIDIKDALYLGGIVVSSLITFFTTKVKLIEKIHNTEIKLNKDIEDLKIKSENQQQIIRQLDEHILKPTLQKLFKK